MDSSPALSSHRRIQHGAYMAVSRSRSLTRGGRQSASKAAVAKIVELYQSGMGSYAIETYMNKTRFRPPNGAPRWTRIMIREILKRKGSYMPKQATKTPPEAVEIIERLASRTCNEINAALEAAGLRRVSRTTVSRIRHRAGMGKRQSDTNARFDRNIRHDTATGCDLWTGGRFHEGYGLFEVDGRNILAHRYAYKRVHGEIPEGHHLHHTCKRITCVNAHHLVPVSRGDHKVLELAEDVLAGIRWEDLEAELANYIDEGWPAWTQGDRPRVGALRPADL